MMKDAQACQCIHHMKEKPSFQKDFNASGANRKSQKFSPFTKMSKKNRDEGIHFKFQGHLQAHLYVYLVLTSALF